MDDHFDGRIQLYILRALNRFEFLVVAISKDLRERAEAVLGFLEELFSQSGEDPAAALPPPRETDVPPHLTSGL